MSRARVVPPAFVGVVVTILWWSSSLVQWLPKIHGFQITRPSIHESFRINSSERAYKYYSYELNMAFSSWKEDLSDRYSYGMSSTNHPNEKEPATANDATSDEDMLLTAAAAITQETCELLGVKSLGVDYGTVRTGVAVTVGYSPKPLAILSDLNSTEACDQIIQMAKSEQVDQIIVGLPFHKNGTVAEQTNLTRVFAEELSQSVVRNLGPGVPVFYFDERYTSKEAAARLRSKDPSQQLYGMLDADAACIILENYYTDNGVGAEQVHVPADLIEKYTAVYRQQQAQEESRQQAIIDERDEKLRRRREAIERDRQMELEQRQAGGGGNAKKKKKKKKKR